jgi:hypothetical protein
MFFELCTLYFVLCTLYFVLCTLYFVLCTLTFVKNIRVRSPPDLFLATFPTGIEKVCRLPRARALSIAFQLAPFYLGDKQSQLLGERRERRREIERGVVVIESPLQFCTVMAMEQVHKYKCSSVQLNYVCSN